MFLGNFVFKLSNCVSCECSVFLLPWCLSVLDKLTILSYNIEEVIMVISYNIEEY